MKIAQLIPITILLVCFSMFVSFGRQNTQAANWNTASGGNWNDTSKWDTADVPDTATETANFPFNGTAGPYIVVVNDTMYPGPGGLTTENLSINTGAVNIGITRFYDIQATGGSGILNWTMGNVANPGSIFIRRNQLTLDNANVDILGTSSSHTIRLLQLANSHPGHLWNIDATDTSIGVTAAPVGSTASGLLLETGSTMRMTSGDLTITNGTSDARISVTGVDSTNSNQISTLELNGTTLTTNEMVLSGQGIFTFNGAGAASTSDVSGSLTISSGGTANLNSGAIDFGSILMDITGTGLTNNVDVNGATVNVAGAVLLKTTNGTTTAAQPDQLNISAGSLTAASLEASGSSTEKGAFEVNVSGTGSLTVNGPLQLGYDDASNRHGAGTLIISGGSVIANSLVVGADRGGDANSSGFYQQTGGTAEFGSIELSRDHASALDYGTKEFVVGSGAELTITGAGFSQVGQGDWLVDDAPGLLDFSGKLVFDPNSVTSQTLLAFGKEFTGKAPDSPATILALIQDNYGIGTLDLSGLDGSEVLNVLPALNELDNALYVDALLGLTDLEAATHLDSTLNIYYNSSSSPLLNGQTIALNSGGALIALTAVPEPSSLLLVSIGAWIGVMRRRKKQVR